ncbi:MAG: type II asparaginase [Syntrophales bacterium]|nr:type II asparaginase [Syntrophales bacterium]MCK9392292.1 type II asparaginase [Syntrophales bacterium]
MVRIFRIVYLMVVFLLLFSVCSFAGVKLPHVVILATGGTIAGAGASTTTTVDYTPAKVGVAALIAAVPELARIARVDGEQILRIGSENMTPKDWLTLAGRVNQLLARADVDGIVITHGTDTLEETAYFLNLTVKSGKPVVLTGAMRPATAISADGPMNLYHAVLLAGAKAAAGKGVLVLLNDQISAAREVTKTNTTAPDTFKTPDLGFLGYVIAGEPQFYRISTKRHTADSEFDVTNLSALPEVGIFYGYAGENRSVLDAMVAKGVSGVVNAGTGDGSMSDGMKTAYREARGRGVIVVRSSRTGSGFIARTAEAKDDEYDFVVAGNLNPQKARILLMLALTKTKDAKEIQRMFMMY